MSNRFYYLRDSKSIQINEDKSHTKGNPVAVVMTKIDKERGVVQYAVASAHPKDNFVKSMARHIVSERLTGTDKRNKLKGSRRGCVHEIPVAVISGHEITKAVMSDISKSTDVPERLRKLADEWLAGAMLPREAAIKTEA